MSQTIRIKRGKDIHLIGEAETSISEYQTADVVALKPTDVVGLNPKLLLKEGAQVKAGTPLFHEKTNERIVFPSPISGVLSEIVRGAKRKILEIRVKSDGSSNAEDFGSADPASLNREQVIDKMLSGGVWPLMRQRPFSIIADPTDVPKGIYISCFDSAPLAPDMDLVIQGQEEAFKAGIEVLRKISNDKVHLSIGAKGGNFFSGISGVTVNRFEGPHPAGNVGVQVHHLDPINRGEKIWYTYPQEVVIIGRLFLSGNYDARKKIAITGSMAKGRGYQEVMTGAPIASVLSGGLVEGNKRIISGNVLTGSKVTEEGFLGYYDNQVTVIPEGDHHKFLLTDGWMSIGFNRFSMSRAYPSWLMGKKKYDLDTNLNGEIRSFVVTGQLEKVFPFDIYPMQLIKAIMVNDIDNMEKMGVYEVDAEDFALCEVACTSKIDIQNVVREGMERLRAELS